MISESSEATDIGRFVRARRVAADPSLLPYLRQKRRHAKHITQGDLAELVGISTVVISQIEQARYPNVNISILQRIARALNLTRQQEAYLVGLLTPRPNSQSTPAPTPEWVVKSINQVAHPILVIDPVFEIRSVNAKAQFFFDSLNFQISVGVNSVATVFLNPHTRESIVDWSAYAATSISGLKLSYAMFPQYRRSIEVFAQEMEAKSDAFREYWNQADPLVKPTIEKEFRHPTLGRLKLFQVLTDIVEASWLTKIEFIPADEETATVLKLM